MLSFNSLASEPISDSEEKGVRWLKSGLAFTTFSNGYILNCYYYARGDDSIKTLDLGFRLVDPNTYEEIATYSIDCFTEVKNKFPEINLESYNKNNFLDLVPDGVLHKDNVVYNIENNIFEIEYNSEQVNITKKYTTKNNLYDVFVNKDVIYSVEENGLYIINDKNKASNKIKWPKIASPVKKYNLSAGNQFQKGFLTLESNTEKQTIFFNLDNYSISNVLKNALPISILNETEVLSYTDDSKSDFEILSIDSGNTLSTFLDTILENHTIVNVVNSNNRFIAIETSGEVQKAFIFEKNSGKLKKTITGFEYPKNPKGKFLTGFKNPNLYFHNKRESLASLFREKVDNKPPTLFLNSYSKDSPNITSNINALIEGRFIDDSNIKKISINDENIPFDIKDGSFIHPVLLESGMNTITIKGVDAQNNEQIDIIILNYSAPIASNLSRGSKPKKTSIENKINNFNYKALIIANQNYSNGVNSLNFPIQDAENLKSVLVDNYSFNEADVTLLKDATRFDIINTLDSLAKTITEEDNLLIFYAGHGIFDETLKKGYWLPVNAHPERKNDWVSNSDIRDYITAFKSQHTLLISDACFSGSIFEYAQRDLSIQEQKITEKLIQKKSRKAMTSGLNKTVPDQSIFVKYLIAELKNNSQEFIRAGELYGGIREAVMANTENNPQYEVIKNSDHEGGEFIFMKKE